MIEGMLAAFGNVPTFLRLDVALRETAPDAVLICPIAEAHAVEDARHGGPQEHEAFALLQQHVQRVAGSR